MSSSGTRSARIMSLSSIVTNESDERASVNTKTIDEAKNKKLCRVDGDLTLKKLQEACRQLLLDPYGNEGEKSRSVVETTINEGNRSTHNSTQDQSSSEKNFYGDDVVHGSTFGVPSSAQASSFLRSDGGSDGDNEAIAREIERIRADTMRAVGVFCERLGDPTIVHGLQVRSVPINEYCNVLRHYFVRVDEMIDVHPGMTERLTLRGWYAETDVASDKLEKQMYLCSACLDVYLRAYWKKTKNFNIILSNCDHAYNHGRQSLFIANLLFFNIIAIFSIFVLEGARLFGVLLFCSMFLFLIIQFVAASSDKRRGVFPCNVDEDANFFERDSQPITCTHVNLHRVK